MKTTAYTRKKPLQLIPEMHICHHQQRAETTDVLTDEFVSHLATTVSPGVWYLSGQSREEMKFSQSLKHLTPQFNSMTRH